MDLSQCENTAIEARPSLKAILAVRNDHNEARPFRAAIDPISPVWPGGSFPKADPRFEPIRFGAAVSSLENWRSRLSGRLCPELDSP